MKSKGDGMARPLAATEHAAGDRLARGDREDGGDHCDHCIEEGELDRLLNGDVPPEVMARFEAHARHCPTCLEELAFFEQLRLDGLLEMPPASAFETTRVACPPPPPAWQTVEASPPSREVAAIAPRRPGSRHLGMWALAASALVAAGLFLVLTPRETPVDSAGGLALSPKGAEGVTNGDGLRLAMTRGAETLRVEPGERLDEGARIGFFYSASSRAYLTIFNVDPAAGATLLFPTHGRSGWVEPGVDAPLGAGAELGPAAWATADGLRCEWIVAVFTDEARPAEELSARLGRPADQARPCDFEPEIPDSRSVIVVPIRR